MVQNSEKCEYPLLNQQFLSTPKRERLQKNEKKKFSAKDEFSPDKKKMVGVQISRLIDRSKRLNKSTWTPLLSHLRKFLDCASESIWKSLRYIESYQIF